MDMNRRFFLGGAISLIAASTFVPSVSAMMNLPTIYGDGKNDDTAGLGALFRNEPVTFKKEMIGVDSHEGLTFHHGKFVVTNSIHIPEKSKINIERATFIGNKLEPNFPFFICADNSGKQFTSKNNFGVNCIFEVKKDYKSAFITYPKSFPEDKRWKGWA